MKAKKAKAQAKYRASPKGQATKAKRDAKYNASPEGKATRAKYAASLHSPFVNSQPLYPRAGPGRPA
jgi:hypothetical protein